MVVIYCSNLTLNVLTTTIVAPPSNASKLEMGFNSVFKGCMKNQQIHQLFIQFGNYVWQLLHVLALHCHLQGAFVVPSERCSAHHVTRCNTPIYNILSTAPQLSIFQKALRTLPEDGNVMPKHVGAAIHS